MKWDPISRRQFLQSSAQGAAQVSLALPLLESLLLPQAKASLITTPQVRLIALMIPHGSLFEDRFFSSRLASNFVQNAQGEVYRHEALANFFAPGQPFDPNAPVATRHVLSPLHSLANKVNVIQGLDIPYYLGHHRGGPLLGHPLDNDQGSAVNSQLQARPTLDRYLAWHPNTYPTNFSGIRSIVLGESLSFDHSNPAARSGQITRIKDLGNDPRSIFRAIFGIYNSASFPLSEQRNLLDLVYEDYLGVRSHPRLGNADRQLLESHVAMVADLQARLSNAPAAMPAAPTTCEQAYGRSCTELEGYDHNYRLQNDLIVAAIRSGLTRIVTKYITQYIWGGAYWHDHAHQANQSVIQDEFRAGHRWMIEKVYLDLLQKLNVPESGGTTYLDNSLVLLQHEHGWTHELNSIPTLLAGSGGGAIRTGLYVDYRDRRESARTHPQATQYQYTGIYQHQLQNTILRAFGLTQSSFAHAPGQGYMELLNPTNPKYVGPSGVLRAAANRPLPYIHL